MYCLNEVLNPSPFAKRAFKNVSKRAISSSLGDIWVGDFSTRLLPVLLGFFHGRLGVNKEINCEEVLFSIRAT
jgi:hypothetical protein